MKKLRKIKKVVKSKAVIEGAGVHLHRAIGWGEPSEYDPFLLLDDFRSDNPKEYKKGFPWHPHRGIETITYVLKGNVEHEDSIGNSGKIESGDLQWMTAGSGIFHQEMPHGNSQGSMHGFQLWANLPAKYKMMNPRYQDIKCSEIPEISTKNGVKINVIAGEYEGIKGPVKDIVIDPEYYDIEISPESRHEHKITAGKKTFVYMTLGSAFFCVEEKTNENSDTKYNNEAENGNLILFEDGDYITIETGKEAARLLLISGKPINEPIAWQGPIVMNTSEELNKAYEELNNGTFIKNQKQ